MLIVLEGCDGAGKSTLASNIARIINAEIVHCSSHTPNDKEFFESIIELSKTRNIVADRFCYGQFVYQNPEDRPLGDVKTLNSIEVKLLEAGAKVVYVTAPALEIRSRLEARREKILNDLSEKEIMRRFESLFSEDSILTDNIVVWNTGGEWNECDVQ